MSTQSVNRINDRIQGEICHQTIRALSDKSLMTEYKQSPSVKKRIEDLENILTGQNIPPITIRNIINEYIPTLVPLGTKGVIRGNKLNAIVRNHILNLSLDGDRFEVCFEKNHPTQRSEQKPDWYITDKTTGKTILGMNQVDLWGGGQQCNRGGYYVIDDKHDNTTCKLLCVVCNPIEIARKTSKTYRLFEVGFKRNTLCYLKNLTPIIKGYFNLE